MHACGHGWTHVFLVLCLKRGRDARRRIEVGNPSKNLMSVATLRALITKGAVGGCPPYCIVVREIRQGAMLRPSRLVLTVLTVDFTFVPDALLKLTATPSTRGDSKSYFSY